MQPSSSTSEILAYKVLNRDIDEKWIDWAVDMLIVGYDTENLVILAGESKPYNQFELQSLTDNVFAELNIDYSNKEKIIKDYARYLIDKALKGEIDSFKVLSILKSICIELDYARYLYDFYSLYFAKDDLLNSDIQMYWEGADKNNIDLVINDYFIKWKTNCEM